MARSKPIEVLDAVALRLRSDPRLGLEGVPFRLALEEETLEIDGEVPSVEVKKRAIRAAESVAGVRWVVDRLRVAPAERMADGAIRDHIVHALIEEPAFLECGIRVSVKDAIECVREPSGPRCGDLCLTVEDGVVALEGHVPTRAHQRLAGVLAWWVPGTRDVVERVDLLSPEEDNDGEIADAIRTALEKDPFLDASQIRVSAANGTATLTGLVSSNTQREMAEQDAWYVSGVQDVNDAIEVG